MKINFYFWFFIYIKEQRFNKIKKILYNLMYKDMYRERRECVNNLIVIIRVLDLK